MKLLDLRLENFQGIKEAAFSFDGISADVYGDNATGKTTLFNSLTWLLFDKASTGAKNFTPKTKGADGDLHYLHHSVEAVFCFSGGRRINLKKVYREDYKKKRGSATEEFNGHVVDYFIDGVPSKEKEYQNAVTTLCGGEQEMKILMMPHFFSEDLTWESRRKILLEVCGDITDHDVFASDVRLDALKSYLLMPGSKTQFYSVDEYKKIANARKTEINRELQTLPARIDEARKAAPDMSGHSRVEVENTIELITGQIEAAKEDIAQLRSGDADATALRRQISTLQTELAEARAAYISESSKANELAYGEINRLKSEQTSLKHSLSDKQAQHRDAVSSLERMSQQRDSLFNEYATVQSSAWVGDEICPTCQQPLPHAEIEKAKDSFNLTKSRRLEEINNKGNAECNKTMIEEATRREAMIADEIRGLQESINTYENLIYEAQQRVQSPPPFESTEEYATITNKIAAMRADESAAGKSSSEQVAAIQGNIDELGASLTAAQAIKANFTLVEQQNGRIKELSDKEKQFSAEFESIQHGIFLCEEFIKAKVSMLTDKINGKFETVRFRLFNQQINGGIKEDCEVMIPSEGRMVPYSYANNAARINAGLEIINTLSRHWSLSMPIFVDNAESVTKLLPVDAQVVRLVVSEPDKSLRIEPVSNPSQTQKAV